VRPDGALAALGRDLAKELIIVLVHGQRARGVPQKEHRARLQIPLA
jgi:hypothetical protein